MKVKLASSINELPKNEFYLLSERDRLKKLEEIWKDIEETCSCSSEELLEELWKLRGKL